MDEGGNRPGTGEVRRAREEGWLSVVEPGNTALVHLLEQDLHPRMIQRERDYRDWQMIVDIDREGEFVAFDPEEIMKDD